MFKIEQEITDEHVSPPYNHVHHATCLRFFETARLRYLEKIGFPNQGFLDQRLFIVISAVEVKYKREVVKGSFLITCENPRIEGKALVVEQRILNSKGKVAVDARVECMFLSGETKRSITPPEDFAGAFCGQSAPGGGIESAEAAS